MRYLGMDYGGFTVGIYDDSSKMFDHGIQRTDNALYRALFALYHHYPAFPILLKIPLKIISYALIRLLIRQVEQKQFDAVILSNNRQHLWYDPSRRLSKKFGKPIINAHCVWVYINAAKHHPKFAYPALVFYSTNRQDLLVYLKDRRSMHILDGSIDTPESTYEGLGSLTITTWVRKLKESVSWVGHPTAAQPNVYALYKKRGSLGKAVVSLKKEVSKSSHVFSSHLFKEEFPRLMEKKRKEYSSIEKFKNDWVASQQQLLRDVLINVQKKYLNRSIRTFIIAGGISRNPSFKRLGGWLTTPSEISGMENGGKAAAFMGHSLCKEGLTIEHDKWKNY